MDTQIRQNLITPMVWAINESARREMETCERVLRLLRYGLQEVTQGFRVLLLANECAQVSFQTSAPAGLPEGAIFRHVVTMHAQGFGQWATTLEADGQQFNAYVPLRDLPSVAGDGVTDAMPVVSRDGSQAGLPDHFVMVCHAWERDTVEQYQEWKKAQEGM